MSPPPLPPPPPPPQAVKQPDTANLVANAKRNRMSGAGGGSSLLTGPSGVTAVPTGRTSLLGG
jgi:hypothetical protein